MQSKTKVIFLLGPTGVGKTEISLYLAKKFNGEIISADSVQVYKEFDIGSAKISCEKMQGIKHYGIDIKDPKEEFSVFDYISYTKEKIEEIKSKGKLPIIVGGTGLYVKALVNGYNFGDAGKNDNFRQEIEKEILENGLESVYEKLCKINPLLAKETDNNNKVRVIRALEISMFGTEKTKSNCEYDFKIFALNLDRALLYDRINKRVDEMVKNGLIKEVETLYKKYGQVQPMKAIGYKEIVEYLDNKKEIEKGIELVKQHSRNYAKRQITFLKGIENVVFVDAQDKDNAKKQIEKKIEGFVS